MTGVVAMRREAADVSLLIDHPRRDQAGWWVSQVATLLNRIPAARLGSARTNGGLGRLGDVRQ